MRCKPSSLLPPLGAAILLLAACAPPAAPAPKAPAVAPTSPAKSEAAPAKPTSAPAQPKSEPTPEQPVATNSSRALADAKGKYYEAAKQEGKLVVYGTTLSPALFDPVKEAFNNLFPGIDIRAEEQTGNISREKIIAEQLAKSYVVDIAFTGFSTTRDLIDAGLVVPYESPQASALIPEFVLPGGLVNPRNASLLSVTVNTNLVPPDQEPKVWNDILDPKWKGKLATQDPRQPGGGGQIISGLALVYGFEFLQQLKTQEVFFGRGRGRCGTA